MELWRKPVFRPTRADSPADRIFGWTSPELPHPDSPAGRHFDWPSTGLPHPNSPAGRLFDWNSELSSRESSGQRQIEQAAKTLVDGFFDRLRQALPEDSLRTLFDRQVERLMAKSPGVLVALQAPLDWFGESRRLGLGPGVETIWKHGALEQKQQLFETIQTSAGPIYENLTKSIDREWAKAKHTGEPAQLIEKWKRCLLQPVLLPAGAAAEEQAEAALGASASASSAPGRAKVPPEQAIPAALSSSSAPSPKTRIAVELYDSAANPIPDEPFTVALPNGQTCKGVLNQQGHRDLLDVDAETGSDCTVVFPQIDKTPHTLPDEAPAAQPVGGASTGLRRDLATPQPASTGTVNRYQLRRRQAMVVEIEHFCDNGAVVLPGLPPVDLSDAAPRVTGIDVLRSVLQHAQKYGAAATVIAGHHESLSRERAENVRCLLTGDRAGWVASCGSHGHVEDVQNMLAWAGASYRWHCDPGPVTNKLNADTVDALTSFQANYNIDFKAAIDARGNLTEETWGAFFDAFVHRLVPPAATAVQYKLVIGPADSIFPAKLAEICTGDASRYKELEPLNAQDMAGPGQWRNLHGGDIIYLPPSWTAAARSAGFEVFPPESPQGASPSLALLAASPPAFGSGSRHLEHPHIDDSKRRSLTRRAEAAFFTAGDDTQLVCDSGGPCNTSTCALYDPLEYDFDYLPVAAAAQASPCKLVSVADVEDTHFALDRYVLMPDERAEQPADPDDPPGITGLDVLAAALNHARRHPNRSMLVTGHTDSTGSASYNLGLSDKRARSVFFVLSGARDEWVKLSLELNATDDWRRILKWADQRFNLNCDPGDLDKPNDPKTQPALANFRKNYDAMVDAIAASGNNPFAPLFTVKLGPGGSAPGPKTWGAFFDLYIREIMRILKVPTFAALLQISGAIEMADPQPTKGCGENHPKDPEKRKAKRAAGYPDESGPPTAEDRRVEILFFDPDEAPPFLCHPSANASSCKPKLCQLYTDTFVHRRIPVGPVPRVKLTLTAIEVSRKAKGQVTFIDERDFAPAIGEHARFHIHIERMLVPFQGTLRLSLGRATQDGSDTVAILSADVCSDSATADVVIEWDGTTTLDVPRNFSDRVVRNQITGNMVPVPMCERSADQTLRHGLYQIEEIALLEQDESVAGSNGDVDDQLSVPAICAARLSDDVQSLENALNNYAFGAAGFVPYRDQILTAIVRRAGHALSLDSAGKQRPNVRLLEGADASALKFDDGYFVVATDYLFEHGFTDFKGKQPPGRLKGSGLNLNTNMDAFYGDRIFIKIAVGNLLPFKGGDTVPKQDPVFRAIFGPLGVDPNSRGDQAIPTAQRNVSGGQVHGRVTDVDEANTVVSIGGGGLVTLTSKNTAIVPDQRAAEIQRAIRAIVNFAGTIFAHELGHALGLVSSNDPSNTSSITVGAKGTATTPFDGDLGDHPKNPPANELMNDGNNVSFSLLVGESGTLSLGPQFAAYLRAVVPLA